MCISNCLVKKSAGTTDFSFPVLHVLISKSLFNDNVEIAFGRWRVKPDIFEAVMIFFVYTT